MYIPISILVPATILLVILFFYKRQNNNNELKEAKQKLQQVKSEITENQNTIIQCTEQLTKIKSNIEAAQREGQKNVEKELSILKGQKEQELEQDFLKRKHDKEALFESELKRTINYYDEENEKLKQNFSETFNSYSEKIKEIEKNCEYQKQIYESLLEPIKQYEKDIQDKLFYTIQVPIEYREDIEYLLTEVAPKIQHPDILNKLIWTEYIKPCTDDLFKRVGIKDEPGIYKLTNINNNKSYIGKSTNVKKRIADHIKGSLQISTIADQYVHHEMRNTGLWNWTMECIIYCSKEKLSELEKYYINFFKTQEYGYNRKEGG